MEALLVQVRTSVIRSRLQEVTILQISNSSEVNKMQEMGSFQPSPVERILSQPPVEDSALSSLLLPVSSSLIHPSNDSHMDREDEDLGSDDEYHPSDGTLSEYLTGLRLDATLPRFVGKSANTSLVVNALEMKHKSNFDTPNNMVDAGISIDSMALQHSSASMRKRPEFWNLPEV